VKLSNALHAFDLRMATEAEVSEAGIVAGSASPVGISGMRIVVDDSVPAATNLVGGANVPDIHLKNINHKRDFTADIVADIALARAGDACPRCGQRLESAHGIEVGHVFKVGTHQSETFGAYYVNPDGDSKPIVMGCYGIGISRLMAAAIEQNHDDKGIVWPPAIAPFQVYLTPLYRDGTRVDEIAEDLYAQFERAGLEALIDDRKESPGVKFNDADLLGIPLRVTISPRTLEKDSAELKRRDAAESELVPLGKITARLKKEIEGNGAS
ncbi:MAG: His/Gly/Thr/Pro-type tRNA ligase C-terminal domain-containing protein, partial [Dehalococcoidales bacterium]